MKKPERSPRLFLYISYYWIWITDSLIRPLKGMPQPDFNDHDAERILQ